MATKRGEWLVSWKIVSALASAALFASAACLGPPGLEGPVEPPDASEAGDDAPDADATDGGPDAPTPPVTGAGLLLKIIDAKIDGAGAVTATVSISDGAGVALDRNDASGGPVSISFALSALSPDPAGGPGQYGAYTTQVHKSIDGTKSEALADADVGGTFTEIGRSEGTYAYRFGTTIPTGYDATKTHTVGVWAYRDVGGKRYVANGVLHFVPAGGPVTLTRAVVTTQACNNCHNPLAFHEGDTARRDAALCILCHYDGMKDPNNGNSLDLRVMVHKIHRGKTMPSVLAGKPYVLHLGSRADDYSSVWFPSTVKNCQSCHIDSQGDRWSKIPTRAVCGSCHDATSFVDPAPPPAHVHAGGPAADDKLCSYCHMQTGSTRAVLDVHRTPLTDPAGPKLTLEIVSVANTAPAQTPILHFKVTSDGAAYDLLAKPWASLAVTLAGPTTDFAQYVQYAIQGAGATGSLALDGAVGSYAYTFPAPIAAGATGSYAVGMEGAFQQIAGATPFYSPPNPVAYVKVTDAAPVPRRAVVERGKCNSCHLEVSAHDGTRQNPDYCVFCHNANLVDDGLVARFQVPTTTAFGLNFKVLIHRIHRGTQLARPYVIGTRPGPVPLAPGGTPVDFSQVRFPGNAKACWACHASVSYLPEHIPAGLLPTKMSQALACNDAPLVPTKYCFNRSVSSESVLGPVGAGCMGCHDSIKAEDHAKAETAGTVENCMNCHGFGKPLDAQAVHTLAP